VRFEFATAGRVIVGSGTAGELPAIARELGRRVLCVTGAHPERVRGVIEPVRAGAGACCVWPVDGEPTLDAIRAGLNERRAADADVVLAIGGGSAIDAGKAVAALATNAGDPLDYLEVVGRGQPLRCPPLPLIAVPTTGGTGAEVTKNAVLGVPDRGVKVSLRSPLMLPRVALVDPILALGAPMAVTASTGLDALTQLIEAYVSPRASPMTDALCLDGLRRASWALPAACADPWDQAAREDMALASLLSGMALANAGLGAVHGLAAAVGGRFRAPHGAVCAALLPRVCAANLTALERQVPSSPVIERYRAVARTLTGREQASARDGVRWMSERVAAAGLPGLASYGAGESDLAALVSAASRASSMKANPVVLAESELLEILAAAL
jgi:alcohol dehydrogenase class IV